MKKILSMMLALCMLASMLSVMSLSVLAEDFTEGYYTYYVDENGNAHIKDVDTTIGGNVTIPLLFDNQYPVVSIESYAFEDCTNIKSVLMLKNLENIGGSAFKNCTGITEVTFSETLKTIGGRAFEGCSGLKSATIPDSVTEIGDHAFDSCERLVSLVIGNGVKTIPVYAFSGCVRLKSVVIGDSVETIEYGSFYNCEKLKDVAFGKNLKSITGYGYQYGAFENCVSIETVIIPNITTYIGERAFQGCTGINNLKLGESVETINATAFNNCTSIPEVYIPDSVITIGDSAFENNTSLKKVDIGNGTTLIGCGAFENSGVETVIIGDKVETIERGAFKNCANLKEIIWGSSLKTIGNTGYTGNGAFENCTSLTTVHIPDTVVTVDKLTFRNCTGLTTVTIGENVSYFGENVFEGCSSLKSIIIPESTLSINRYMFSGCTSLESIYLPADLQTILPAFGNCTSLKDVYYAGSEEDWNDFVDVDIDDWYHNNDALINATYHYDCDTRIPTGSIDSQTPENTLATSHDIVLTLWDNVGVAGYYWGTDPDHTKNPYTETSSFSINKKISQAGTYYLVVKDVNGFISTRYSITFHNVTLNANGGTLSGISSFLAERAESIIPAAPTHSNAMYVFAGWATYQNATEGSESISPSGDKTYYAVWMESKQEAAYMIGDINDNKKIDMTDYILLKRAYFGTYKFTEIQNQVGDINANEKIDMTDYILLKRAYFGTYTIDNSNYYCSLLTGIYKGSYFGGQGETGLTLTVYKEDGQYKALFDFYNLPGKTNAKNGKYYMSVEYNAKDGSYSLKGTEWIEKPSTYLFVNLGGILKDNTFSGDSPTKFSVTRI